MIDQLNDLDYSWLQGYPGIYRKPSAGPLPHGGRQEWDQELNTLCLSFFFSLLLLLITSECGKFTFFYHMGKLS